MLDTNEMLFKVVFLAADRENRLVRSDRIVGTGFQKIYEHNRSQITIGEGRQKLIDEYDCRVWITYNEVRAGQRPSEDGSREFLLLSTLRLDEIRALLDQVFGLETETIVHIEMFVTNTQSVHIG